MGRIHVVQYRLILYFMECAVMLSKGLRVQFGGKKTLCYVLHGQIFARNLDFVSIILCEISSKICENLIA